MNQIGFKRNYLHWFLDTQRLKWPKTAKLLKHIIENEHILERIEFVEDINYYRNALMISGRGTATYPFVLRLDGQYIYDVDQAIEALEAANFYKLYVKISYSKGFAQQELKRPKTRSWKIKKAWLGKVSQERKESFYRHLMALVDITLDRRDKEGFYRLTNQLKKLSNN